MAGFDVPREERDVGQDPGGQIEPAVKLSNQPRVISHVAIL
jgi:hypothetical protein